MANYAKFKRGALGHMCRHFERGTDNKGEPIKYGNQNIDTSKSYLNYNLAPHHDNQYQFIKNRCDEVYCLNRKDVNVMCSWCVTVPKDLPESEHRKFFESTFDFLSKRYGIENVISAYVHCDERTPHMHFAFVPVCYDKQRERYTVNAKKTVTKKDLQTLHPDLEKYVSEKLGHHVGIMTGELSDRPDLTLEQYRSMKETEERLSELLHYFEEVQTAVARIEQQLQSVNLDYEAKKKYVSTYEKTQEAINDGVKEHHSFLKGDTVEMTKEKWESTFVPFSDKKATAEMREATEQQIKAIKKMDFVQKYSDIAAQYTELSKHTAELERGFRRTSEELKRIQNIIKSNPQLQRQFIATEQALNELHNRIHERDNELCR